jgi:hypothetical protein
MSILRLLKRVYGAYCVCWRLCTSYVTVRIVSSRIFGCLANQVHALSTALQLMIEMRSPFAVAVLIVVVIVSTLTIFSTFGFMLNKCWSVKFHSDMDGNFSVPSEYCFGSII